MLNVILIGKNTEEIEHLENYLQAQFTSIKATLLSFQAQIIDNIEHLTADLIVIQNPDQQEKGTELCRKLKNTFASRFIPVLLIGQKQYNSTERVNAVLAGADAFIGQPYDETELIATINMLLRIKKTEDTLRTANEELKRQVQLASDELQSKEKRYAEMFDAAGNIIILIDQHRKIVEWNQAAELILECSKSFAIGQNFETVLTNKVMRADLTDRYNRVLDVDEKSEYLVNIRTNSGMKYQVLWKISHLKDLKTGKISILLIGQDVSLRVQEEKDRKRNEAKLRSNYLFLNTLLNSLPSLVYYKDTSGHYLGCNENFASFFGYSQEQIIGKHTNDLNPGPEASEIIKEDAHVFKTGIKQVRQFVKKYPGGKSKYFIVHKTAFYKPDKTIGGLVGVMVDISKLKEMEEALRQSEMFFKGITDSANDAIVLTDKKSRIQFWNKAAELLFGYQRFEVINKNLYHFLISKNEVEKLDEHLQKIYQEKDKSAVSNSLEINAITKDGKTFPAEFSNSIISFNDKTSVIYIIKNIELRKQAEKMLLDAKEKAEEADRLKTAFLSNMSHEIRTPMNAIVGFSQLLANDSISEDKRQLFIEQINVNSESLLAIIDDIIHVSKIESGKIEIKLGMCLLNSVMDEIYTGFLEHRRRMGKEHVEILLSKGVDNANFSILTDNQRFRQILTNLIGNALKFTDKGYVSFGYKIRDKESLLFYVKDTGLGINSEKIEYVFDRFTKIAANKTKLYGGTGLGLSITKHLVEQLGGKIWVESTEGKGSNFFFILPHQGISQEKEKKQPEPPKKLKMDLRNASILIAEDEQMNFLFLQEALYPSGAKITWAKNGKEALELIQNNHQFDIILMDMKMPIMDGYEATRKIKKIRPDIPVIAQTAYAMPEEQKKGFESGCDFYLSKPIDPLILINTLKKHLPSE
jgi:PAS domain S-box-containing protein